MLHKLQKPVWSLLFWGLFFFVTAAPVNYPQPLIVEESDGSPSVKGAWKIKVTNGTLTQSGAIATLDLSGSGGGVGFGLPDPNADRIYFWDDGASANAFLAPGNSIAITGTTLDTIQDIRTTSSPVFTNLDLATGGGLRTATAAGNTLLLQAYDVDGAAYTTFATLTANNTPTLDLATGVTIASAYIYRVGGTDISLADGGTAASLTASTGGIVYSGASAMAILSGTATANQALLSGSSAAPAWSTATYPATTTVNQLLYSSSANTVVGLATGNSGVLVTSGAGVPSIGTDIPTAVTIGTAYVYRAGGTDIALADGGTNASLVASNGGIFYSTATAGAILAGTATANQILMSGVSAAPAWSTATYPATAAGTGTILRADGTNFVATTATYPTTTTANQLFYSSATNVVDGLATAASGLLVTSGAGVPSIGTDIPTAVTIGGQYVYRVGGTDISIADGGTGVGSWTNGQLLIGNTTGNTAALATLTGTANQITVTNGASSITLTTPQDLATASTPQFARLGLGAAADATNILTTTSASTTDLSKAINVTHTGAITGTGYGGYFSKTGVSTTNVGLYATASGGTNNYAAIFEAGNVGFGTTDGFGTSAAKVLSIGAGTAPTTSPANVTQAWTADWNGAGTNALFLRTEEGTQHVFGSNVGIGTTEPLTKLDVRGSGYVESLNVNYGVGGDANGIINGGTNLYLRPQSGALINDTGATYLTGGNVGIGTVSPDRLLHPELADATTAAVSYVQRLSHIVSTASTGSSDGFGVGLEFELETGTDGTNQISGTIESLWATAANATRKGRLNLYAYDTAARLGLTVEASGAAAMLGFYGVTAVIRPTALTTQLTSITHTAPGTPDYALQNLVQNTGFGFVTADEGNTFLSVVLNLQTRLAEVEQKLEDLGLLTP